MSRSSEPVKRLNPHHDLNRLIMRKLMPLLILAYILAFLDRTNIGLAKDAMQVDIGLSAAAYGLGAGLFFLAYAICEVPSNLIMHRVGARLWISRIMITWGLISAAMAFVQGPTSFYILRMLLGAAEAGLFPGVMLYLTYWFGREDRARANGYFLLGVCVANIVGAPLGGLLLGLDGLAGWHGWQWMFVIEGLPAVALAFVVFKVLPDRPSKARWLTTEQARELESRLNAEQEEGAKASGTHSFGGVFKDRKIMLAIAVYFTHQIAVYSVTYFLSTIIRTYGDLTDLEIGLLTALPWVAAGFGAYFLPRLATNDRRSRYMLLSGLLTMATGLAIAAVAGPVVALLGFSFCASAFFVVQSILFAFPASRLSGVALAGGIALVNTLGILGGFVGPTVMGLVEEITGNPTSGLWFVVVLLLIGAVLSLGLHLTTIRLDRGEKESAA